MNNRKNLRCAPGIIPRVAPTTELTIIVGITVVGVSVVIPARTRLPCLAVTLPILLCLRAVGVVKGPASVTLVLALLGGPLLPDGDLLFRHVRWEEVRSVDGLGIRG